MLRPSRGMPQVAYGTYRVRYTVPFVQILAHDKYSWIQEGYNQCSHQTGVAGPVHWTM